MECTDLEMQRSSSKERSYFESLRFKINQNKSSRQGSPITKGLANQNSASKSDKFSTPLQAIRFDSNVTSSAKKGEGHCEYGELLRPKKSSPKTKQPQAFFFRKSKNDAAISPQKSLYKEILDQRFNNTSRSPKKKLQNHRTPKVARNNAAFEVQALVRTRGSSLKQRIHTQLGSPETIPRKRLSSQSKTEKLIFTQTH